jgi:D-galactose 1-dehydrogenase
MPLTVAIVGVGKIARDQHVPSIAASDRFELGAGVSRNARIDGVETFARIEEMLAARPDITCVALCMPPSARHAAAHAALTAGRHVLLEKPPGATIAEVQALERLAAARGLTLYATWHSRHAPMVEAARAWLAGRTVRRATITWREDVRRWHPGQDWIWKAGGVGVFDPGINALSILTHILPAPVHVTAAELEFPANAETPIAARIAFAGDDGATVTADFDWRQQGDQTWDIAVETDGGRLDLSLGGTALAIDGTRQDAATEAALRGEYDTIYARFADLIDRGASDVDLAPLVHVADAFMLGRRQVTDAFHWQNDA